MQLASPRALLSESGGSSWTKAAVFAEKKSIGGTFSQRIIASARALVRAGLSANVPAADVTSIIGILLLPFIRSWMGRS